VINKKAIKRFLERPLDRYDWLKRYSLKDVLPELAALKPVPDFGKIKPWLHQYICFLLTVELKRFMFNVDMGGGKTGTILMFLLYRKQRGEKFKAVVFVPYITSIETWIEQVAEHAPSLRIVPLLGTTGENLEALKQEGDLFVICYQSAVAMVTETVFDKAKGKNKWQLTARQVRKYFEGFDTIICDEIHKNGSPSSLVFRMCRAISRECEYGFGLTGTPFGKSPEMLWPQFYLIDFGATLGPSMEFFKAVFFTQSNNYWGGMEFTFKKKLMPDLRRMIKNCSIRYSIDELHGMPEKVYVPKYVNAAPDAEAYCKAALKQINEAVKSKDKGSYRIVENNYLKLQQLSSGFMTFTGDDSSKIKVAFPDNPKLEALIDLIESMPSDCKIVVFHHFVYTNELISKRLKELKIGHARIWGGQRDPIGQLRKFKTDANCIALIINDQSGSSSLNLQNANYLCFFEQPNSPINRQQAERRVWRPGQSKRVFIYDFFTRGTADYAIHKSNKDGEDLMQSLLANKVVLQ
jgi:SNF2 family DNA or RNA helicase